MGGNEWSQGEKAREHGADFSHAQITRLVKPASEEFLRIKLMQVPWLQRG